MARKVPAILEEDPGMGHVSLILRDALLPILLTGSHES